MDRFSVGTRPLTRPCREPFICNGLERFDRGRHRSALTPPLGNRIAPFADHLPGFEGHLTGRGEGDLRVDADREQLFLTVAQVLLSPWTSRNRPPPSASLYGLGPGFACRILVSVRWSRAMGVVGKRDCDIPPAVVFDTPESTPKSVGWQCTASAMIGRLIQPTSCKHVRFWTLVEVFGQ